MNRLILTIILVVYLALPVNAVEFTVPQAPESAENLMPEKSESFGEDLAFILKKAITAIRPEIMEAARICLSVFSVVLLVSIICNFSPRGKKVSLIAGTVGIGTLLMRSTTTMINMGADVVRQVSEYGKLLLPVMTASLAAEGGATASVALYTATTFFNTILTTVIVKILVPMIYIYTFLSVANSALQDRMVKEIRNFIKWLMVWSLKIILYIFTGYIGITGVVSGSADAAAIKAAKLTISGVVPVVGSILSDASEAVLVGAGVMKNAAGVYGVLTIIALFIGPFIKVGCQYLMLRVTAAACASFSAKESSELVQDFSAAMGYVLAITGSVCLMLLISTVCFMKGMT